jgi:hypothetical protein
MPPPFALICAIRGEIFSCKSGDKVKKKEPLIFAEERKGGKENERKQAIDFEFN